MSSTRAPGATGADVILDLDPATGETIAELPVSSASDVTAAVARAGAAGGAWASLPLAERSRRLSAGCARLAEREEELGRLVTREMGKPVDEARREIRGCASSASQVLAEVEEALRQEVRDFEGTRTTTTREPLGVVAAITPWNFPIMMPLDILLPALATGNTVVFKPSEHVPLSGAALHECLAAELPAGVLELVQGPGSCGAALVEADVAMIAFVGSRATGQRIMAAAASGLKRLVLELGGKDPLVVFADADLEAAADCAVLHSLRNAGQVCCSVERIFVAEEVFTTFEALVLERARTWSAGDPMEAGTKMGPMVSAEQRDKVALHVEDARAKGARILLGGATPSGPGNFYPPTVIADAPDEAALSREETFGPIVALQRFSGSEEDGVRLANDTPYGLGANVFTADRERAQRVAAGIRAGQVGINRYLGGGPGTPWVGARQSGLGFLGGLDGHRQFTVPKSTSIRID